MNRQSISGLLGLVLVALGIRLPFLKSPETEQPDKFLIYVTGKGLDGSGYSDPVCAQQQQQTSACAMARGVHAAFLSEQFQRLRTFVDYREADDHGRPDDAKKLASRLGDDAHVLAVIGHSYSDTTAQAVPLYAAAQIPLLIPIATSPAVGYDLPPSLGDAPTHGMSPHFQNVFRLIPNDRIGQAPSIAYIVRKLRASAPLNVAVLADLSDNEPYTKSLEGELLKRLPDAETGEVDKACKDDKDALSQSCLHWGNQGQPPMAPELLIFVGTGKSGKRFLNQSILDHDALLGHLRYLLVTDGAKNVDPIAMQQWVRTSIPLLLTFPTKQIDKTKLPPIFKPLGDALLPSGSQSYEEYGFDSMLLISIALGRIMDSKEQISRRRLVKELGQIDTMTGATNIFIFHEGENVHPDYSIYGAGTDDQMAGLQKTLCGEPDSTAPPGGAQGLRYLCYVGFDKVNFQ
jgi:hypothetical protein